MSSGPNMFGDSQSPNQNRDDRRQNPQDHSQSGPKVFEMKKPFTHRGEMITSMKVREPTVRDLRIFIKTVEVDSIAAIESVLANLTGYDEQVFESMSLKDFGILRAHFEGFLGDMVPDSET